MADGGMIDGGGTIVAAEGDVPCSLTEGDREQHVTVVVHPEEHAAGVSGCQRDSAFPQGGYEGWAKTGRGGGAYTRKAALN